MGVTNMKYRVLVSFCPQTGNFRYNRSQTPMDFEQKIDFLKNHKNSYMGPLWTTNPQYGATTKKYGVSVNFCPKLVIFGKTVG
jgi:hypothetical protein